MGPKMSRSTNTNEDDIIRLVVAITDFLRDQLDSRNDFDPEDRDCLEIAIQCLEMAYGLDAHGYLQYRFARPLIDIFNQVANPVSVRDKLQADAYKDEGNQYMRRSMYSQAEAAYTSAIELDRWNSIYYCNRASSRIGQRNFFDAIADCRQALLLSPDYAKAHARMGQAYALIDRHREAARCFRQAMDLEPDNDKYRNNLRVAEQHVNRPDTIGLITTVLNSIFGSRPHSSANTQTRPRFPTSFMIITEMHPETTTNEQVQQNADQSQEISQAGTEPGTESNNMNNIEYRPPFGVYHEDTEESSSEMIITPEIQSRNGRDDNLEFSLEFPLFPFQLQQESCTCTSDNYETAEESQSDEKQSEEEENDVKFENGIEYEQENNATTGEIEDNGADIFAAEISMNDNDIKDEKQITPSSKITSECNEDELSIADKKSVENSAYTTEEDKRNAVWLDISDSVMSLVTTVENAEEKSAKRDTGSAETLNIATESCKRNSVLKDVAISSQSVISNIETGTQALTSADGDMSAKSSKPCSEEAEENTLSKDISKLKTPVNLSSNTSAESKSEKETIKPKQTVPTTQKNIENTENVEQDSKTKVVETKQILPHDTIEETKTENNEQECKTAFPETDDHEIFPQNDDNFDQVTQSSGNETKRNEMKDTIKKK